MKALSNPWVSGALAVVAAVVVVYQFAPLHRSSAPVAVAPPARGTASVPHPAPASSATAAPAEVQDPPSVAIDCASVEGRFARWAEAPSRDPFWLLASKSEGMAHKYPSPVLFWKLNGIWRQTGGRVAAIDNRVYAEGEKVHGYRILTIDAEQVVFEGPDGPEALTFTPVASKSGKKR